MVSRLNTLVIKAYEDWVFITKLFSLFRNRFSVKLILLSTLKFTGKFSNMLVMFLPLKIFLLISGTSQVGMFKEIEEQLGTNAYISLILFVTSLLYILNLVIQIYYSRAFNLEKLKLQGTKDFDGMSIKFIRKLYTPYIDVLSSLVMLCISFWSL